jgi:uncharacterized pyridoxamine 5'-phosphate oxidase family protein
LDDAIEVTKIPLFTYVLELALAQVPLVDNMYFADRRKYLDIVAVDHNRIDLLPMAAHIVVALKFF